MRAIGEHQLMSCVAQEALLACNVAIQSCGHPIDRGAELTELVEPRDGKLNFELTLCNLPGGAAHMRNRSHQTAPEGKPAKNRDQHQGESHRYPWLGIKEEGSAEQGRRCGYEYAVNVMPFVRRWYGNTDAYPVFVRRFCGSQGEQGAVAGFIVRLVVEAPEHRCRQRIR